MLAKSWSHRQDKAASRCDGKRLSMCRIMNHPRRQASAPLDASPSTNPIRGVQHHLASTCCHSHQPTWMGFARALSRRAASRMDVWPCAGQGTGQGRRQPGARAAAAEQPLRLGPRGRGSSDGDARAGLQYPAAADCGRRGRAGSRLWRAGCDVERNLRPQPLPDAALCCRRYAHTPSCPRSMQATPAALNMSAAQSLLLRALNSTIAPILPSLQALSQPCFD